MNYSNPLSLQHYGIKGMKWGVRRYRKENGSLTAAGKKRSLSIIVRKMPNMFEIIEKSIPTQSFHLMR